MAASWAWFNHRASVCPLKVPGPGPSGPACPANASRSGKRWAKLPNNASPDDQKDWRAPAQRYIADM